MPIVQSLVPGQSGSGISCPTYDLTVTDYDTYLDLVTIAPATGSGNIARDLRSNRLFRDCAVGSEFWWLPYECTSSATLDYTQNSIAGDCKFLYEEAMPSGVTSNNVTKSADDFLTIQSGVTTNYALMDIPTASNTKRLLVCFPKVEVGDSLTVYLGGHNNVLPRILYTDTYAKLSMDVTPIADGINTPIDEEPIFMFSDTTDAAANTMVFCPATPYGHEAVASRASLGTYISTVFGATAFAPAKTMYIRHLFSVEV